MIYKAIKGSKIPIVIEVEGLGTELNLNDESVGLECTFYSEFPHEREDEPPKTITYKKGDKELFEAPDGGGNAYIALVDTSLLDCGILCCGAKITYTDKDLAEFMDEEQVIEIAPSRSDFKIIEPYINKQEEEQEESV